MKPASPKTVSIGSTPEIGVTFSTIHGFDFARWRELVGDDLLGGYGRLCFPPRGADNRHSQDPEVSKP